MGESDVKYDESGVKDVESGVKDDVSDIKDAESLVKDGKSRVLKMTGYSFPKLMINLAKKKIALVDDFLFR